MYEPRLAFIFPAFAQEYPEESRKAFTGFEERFRHNLNKASYLISPCMVQFDFAKNNLLEDELKTQFITYVYSCTLGEILQENNIRPDYISGFSMGIYAALKHAGSITFDDGLRLINRAFLESIRCLKSRQFAMGSVIGLEREDILRMIDESKYSAEITNQNSRYSFTLSGLFAEVTTLIEKAREEGALHTRLLRASIPYHSKFLQPAAEGFSEFVKKTGIVKPEIPVISQVDQSLVTEPGHIREELSRNLFTHLSWMKTQERLTTLGTKSFVELGPGRNLSKNARFIEGDAKFYEPQSLVS